MFEEVGYECKLSRTIEDKKRFGLKDSDDEIGFDKLFLDVGPDGTSILLDELWFVSRHLFWAPDIEYGVRMRSRTINQVFFFADWHNLECHGMSTKYRRQFYVTVPDWFRSLEPCRLMLVPTPPVLLITEISFLTRRSLL